MHELDMIPAVMHIAHIPLLFIENGRRRLLEVPILAHPVLVLVIGALGGLCISVNTYEDKERAFRCVHTA